LDGVTIEKLNGSPGLGQASDDPYLVVGTGVDPVTSRFSGARSTN
jgi:hypothetical protein